MSYELFFGLPGHRVLRISELHAYYKFETSRPRSARAKDASGLPAPVRDFLASIQTRLPEGAALSFFKSSLSITFDPAHLEALRAGISSFADALEILYFDSTGGGWFDAQKPAENALAFPTYTSERGIMKYVAPGDRDILFDEDWFVDGQFFVISPRDQQFLQILRTKEAYLIEFRAGPGRPIFRSEQTELAPVQALFEGYLAGRNMNTPEYEFITPSMPEADVGLPRRDAWGRWFPQPVNSTIAR